MIEDRKVAIGYAIEAIRVFDHLHFRVVMKEALGTKPTRKTDQPPAKLVLQKPTAISGKKRAWFDRFYVANSQLEGDRKLFSR